MWGVGVVVAMGVVSWWLLGLPRPQPQRPRGLVAAPDVPLGRLKRSARERSRTT